MEDAPKWLKIPKSECPEIWIRLPRDKWPKSLSSMEDPVSWAKSVWSSLGRTVGKSSKLGMLICKRFLSVYVHDIKLAGKKQNLDPMWEVLMKDVDLGEPTSFLDHVYLGCTQRARQTSKDIVENYRNMFELWETWRKHLLMVLWYGRSCKEMRGTILRSGEQNNSTAIQRRNSMPSRKQTWELLENCQKSARTWS